jgi:LmbE family N-acetylglucosaminyl deacetylase
MKTLIFGAHPDDPESGCGGLAAQSVKAGHEVVFLYATAYRQGRQFFGRTEREVRTEEALSACEVIGVRGIILDFLHEGIDVNTQNVEKITEVLMKEHPDIVRIQITDVLARLRSVHISDQKQTLSFTISRL